MVDGSLAVQVVSGLDGWERQWDGLVDAASLPSPFLRSWWLGATAGPRGQYVLVVEDDRLIGGLALDERRAFGLSMLTLMGSRGHLCPDHLDLVSVPGEEDRAVRALRAWLFRPGARVLDFRGVRSGSRLEAVLPPPAHHRSEEVAPFVHLSAGRPYLDGLSSRFRQRVRRDRERLRSAGVTHRVHRGPGAVASLDTLHRLHLAQWGRRSHFLPEFDRFAAACRQGARADEVVAHELGTDTETAVVVVAFEVAGRVSLYQSARQSDVRWRGASSVLLTSIIEDAERRGLGEVDFLRGDEAYKAKYARGRRTMVRLLAGNGLTGRLGSTSAVAAVQGRRVAERWMRARHSEAGSGP